ncbi:MAG: hypothetical protein ACOX1S_13345 [Anaerostipes sp.]|jgi:hypothetical protein
MSKMREVDGYLTVEMSFILPIICFALVILMSFFFYLMDYGIVKGIVEEENQKAVDVVKTNGKLEDGTYSLQELNNRNIFYLLKPETKRIENETEKKIRTNIKGKIILAKIQKVSVQMTGKKITTNVIVDVKVPILGSVSIFGIHLFRMKIEEENGIHMEAESVRRWDIIENKKD